MAICAYCNRVRPLTREHVIPSFIYAFQKELESVIGWNEVAGKMVPGEFKVKDVCADCNNTVLGTLDSCAKALLLQAGVLVPNYTRTNLTLRYEFDLLVRWLLKVSFNSARTDGAHRHLFESLLPYILGEAAAPPRSKLTVLAYLASPERLDVHKRGRPPYAKVAGSSDLFNPFLVRISYGTVAGADNYTLRINIFGPLVFYMLFFHDGALSGHAAAAVRRFLKLMPGAVELKQQRKVVELAAGRKSWADLYQNQAARVRELRGVQDG